MKIIRLKPIQTPPTLSQELEQSILHAITREIYANVLKILKLKPSVIKNAVTQSDLDKLGYALREGTLTYADGMFSGSLDSNLTRALRDAGATWDSRRSVFRLSEADLEPELEHLIHATRDEYERRVSLVDSYLSKIDPAEVSGKVAVSRLFDNAIKRSEKDFQQNVKAITLAPELTDEQRASLVDRWKENAHESIKSLVTDQVSRLRGRVAQSVEVGTRYSNLVKGIQAEHGVSQGRAKLIARQETKTLVNTYAEERYADAGVQEYYWHNVLGTPKHPIRPIHKALGDASKKGKTYRFDDPPVVDETGRRANPGFDFNCVTGDSKINFFGNTKKLFRRYYTGKLSVITTNSSVLNVTPNHPVLTSRGWIPAKDVQLGDDLIKIIFNDGLTKASYDYNSEPSFEKLFDFFRKRFASIPFPVSTKHFHGDGIINQDVDVVCVENRLMHSMYASIIQFFKKFKFTNSDVMPTKRTSSPPSKTYTLMIWLSIFSKRLIGRCCQGLTFFYRCMFHACIHSIRSISNLINTKMLQVEQDLSSSDSISFGQSQDTHTVQIKIFDFFREIWNGFVPRNLNVFSSRGVDASKSEFLYEISRMDVEMLHDVLKQHPSIVQLDRVIDHRAIDFSDHVYNLENEVNWYSCNGLIVHNCRCWAQPIIKFGGK